MRAYPTDPRKREIPIPPTYGGTAMEKRPSEEKRVVAESHKETKERSEEHEKKSAPSFKASPSAAGVLLPRYDSEEGAGLERLAAEDQGYSLRTRENAKHDRRSLPRQDSGEIGKPGEAALPVFKKLFGDGDISETTLVALLLLLLGMGEDNGTPLLLLGLLLLLS